MSTGIKLEDCLICDRLLVNKDQDINFEVPGMNVVVAKFKQNGMRLLDEHFFEKRNHKIIKVDLFLGIDVFQYISSVTDKKLGGSCLVLNDKVAPIDNVFSFLSPEQSKLVM